MSKQTWQAEPTEEGWYWVCDIADECPRVVFRWLEKGESQWYSCSSNRSDCLYVERYKDSMRCIGPLKPPKLPEV